MTQPQRIIVLGAGITGLAAAHRCRESRVGAGARGRRDRARTLGARRRLHRDALRRRVHRGDRPGFARHGETGRARFGPAPRPGSGRNADASGIPPARASSAAGGLIPIPDDFRLFTPTSLAGLVRSRLFSPAGLSRAAVEPFVPRRRDDGDESLASFVTRRFGSDVLNRLAQPLIGGIYCGDPKRLSMQATMPQMLALERKHGSVVLAMRSASRKARGAAPPPPRLVSLRGGLGTLTAALQRERATASKPRATCERCAARPAATAGPSRLRTAAKWKPTRSSARCRLRRARRCSRRFGPACPSCRVHQVPHGRDRDDGVRRARGRGPSALHGLRRSAPRGAQDLRRPTDCSQRRRDKFFARLWIQTC